MRRKFLNDIDKIDFYTDKSGDCWLWTGVINRDGYGQVNTRTTTGWTTTSAHRFTYIVYMGPVSRTLHIDHLCKNRGCVKPDHLEAVTRLENVARSRIGELNRAKTKCKQGHRYSDTNTRIWRNHRICKRCQYLNLIKSRAKKKATLIN